MPKQLNNGKQKKFCNVYDVDCVNGAITKRGVSDRQLAAYFHDTYYDIGKEHDSYGRTALHMAASCGRSELCEWLIGVAGANINCKDFESGYTPLQRALFHGHVRTAVRLMQMGADMMLLDREGLTAVDLVTKDRPKQIAISHHVPCQVYMWGTNDNYTLGIGTNKSRKVPDLLDNFRRRNVSILQICMDEFHSVFVSQCNKIWVCGISQGGRLGASSEKHLLTPSLLLSNNECLMAAVALNHTLVLLSTGVVLACGQNEYHQLGISPYLKNSKTLKQVSIKPSEDLVGVCAGKYHSVFYTKRFFYVCGLNGGQLGLSSDKNNVPFVQVPTQVPINLKSGSVITAVSSSSTCIAFSVSNGNIFILYQFMFKKIATKQLNVKQIGTTGGVLNSDLVNEGGSSLKVVLLTVGGSILIWQESVPQLTRCMFGLNRLISISSIFLNEKQILFTTSDGEAFLGTIGQIEKQTVNNSKEEKSGFHKFVEKSECYHVSTKRIPNVHRAVAIASDPKGKNFAVIQVHPQHALTEVPTQSSERILDQLKQLLDESSELDPVHDVIFKVKNNLFPAHKYIIASAESSLLSMPFVNGVIVIDDVSSIVFKEILNFVYTGRCDLLQLGPVSSRFLDCNEDPLKLLLIASNKYKLSSLYKNVSCYKYENGCVIIKDSKILPKFEPPKFKRHLYPELHDVNVKSEDGKILKAHKCILAARLDYFHNMLMGGWSESHTTPVLHIDCPVKPLEVLLDYLYTNEIPVTISTDSFEHLGRLLIISDQLLCYELKEVCEISLVNALTLKNAATMLQVAFIYNAPQLKKSVMQFISLNLDTIIENRILDNLDDKLLLELDEYYRNFSSVHYSKRIITPYDKFTISDDIILSSLPIAWPENMMEIKSISDQKEKQPKANMPNAKKKSSLPKKSSSPDMVHEDKIVKKPGITIENAKPEPIVASSPNNESALNMLDFPSLNSSPTLNSYNKFHHKNSSDVRVIYPPKLSQKERKRRTSESADTTATDENSTFKPKPVFKGWTIIPPIDNYIKEDNKQNFATSQINSSFVNIIANEKQEKDNFHRMRTKSFMLTQMEDKAIEELYEFYNAANIFDETITIERVLPEHVAKPVWIKTQKKTSQ